MNQMTLFGELRRFSCMTDIHRLYDGAELFLMRAGTPERYAELLAFLGELGFSEVRSHTIGAVAFNILAQDNHVLT